MFPSRTLANRRPSVPGPGKWHFKVNTCQQRQSELYPDRPNGGAFGCGFDHQYGALGGHIGYYDRKSSRWSRDGKRVHEQGYSPDLIAAETVRIIDAHAAETKRRLAAIRGVVVAEDEDDAKRREKRRVVALPAADPFALFD